MNFRITELNLEIRNGRLRGVAVCFGGIKSALVIGIVERGEELSLFHARSLVKVNAGYAPSNLGRDRGSAARGNVPAGVQCRLGTLAIRLGGHGDLDDGLLTPQGKRRGDNGAKDKDRNRGVNHALAHARLRALAIMNTQGPKIGL